MPPSDRSASCRRWWPRDSGPVPAGLASGGAIGIAFAAGVRMRITGTVDAVTRSALAPPWKQRSREIRETGPAEVLSPSTMSLLGPKPPEHIQVCKPCRG
jgi:hypothetical protein